MTVLSALSLCIGHEWVGVYAQLFHTKKALDVNFYPSILIDKAM
jgi:hypothetical protein